MRSRLFGLLALAALIAIALPVIVIERLAVGARDDAALSATPLTVAQAVSAITDPVPAEDWVVKSARRRSGSDPDLMGPAGAALVNAVAHELKLKKAELDGVAMALTKATAALAVELNATQQVLAQRDYDLERLARRVEALETPWLGRAGELACAFEHRCNGYVEAGEQNLSAVASVTACREHCARAFPAVPFFAFHNELGMVQFLSHPKGRCRCYDSVPCDLVPDGGYTLWSTTDACPDEVPPQLRGAVSEEAEASAASTEAVGAAAAPSEGL